MKNEIKYMDDIADILNKVPAQFESLWSELYQFYPDVNTLSFSEREQWKLFTKKIVNHFVNNLKIDDMCNTSFDIGRAESKEDTTFELTDKFSEIIEDASDKLEQLKTKYL